MGSIRKIGFLILCAFSFFAKGECGDLILIIACDTQAENIDDTIFQDLSNIRAEGERISSYTGMPLVEYFFTGEDLNPSTFFTALKGYQIQHDDMVFFFFSGHGYRTPSMRKDPWPNFYFTFTDQGVSYKQVLEILQNKRPRLLISLADCCNNVIEDALAPSLAIKKASFNPSRVQTNYKKLFLNSKGTILITSSKVGQESWCIPAGAIYTLAFLENIKHETEGAKQASWSTILKGASKMSKRYQTPYYELKVK